MSVTIPDWLAVLMAEPSLADQIERQLQGIWDELDELEGRTQGTVKFQWRLDGKLIEEGRATRLQEEYRVHQGSLVVIEDLPPGESLIDGLVALVPKIEPMGHCLIDGCHGLVNNISLPVDGIGREGRFSCSVCGSSVPRMHCPQGIY